MSDPGPDFTEAAVALAAVDFVLCDDMTCEDAVAFARRQWDSLEDATSPWRDGAHCGDCTKVPMTCSRCFCESYEDEARKRYDE